MKQTEALEQIEEEDGKYTIAYVNNKSPID